MDELYIRGIIVLIVVFMFNKMTSREVSAETQWADVESAYQRRADLIPNLVNTVKGYAAHEKETLYFEAHERELFISRQSSQSNLNPCGN